MGCLGNCSQAVMGSSPGSSCHGDQRSTIALATVLFFTHLWGCIPR